MAPHPELHVRRAIRAASGVFAGIALIVIGLSCWYYQAEADKITRAQYQSLAAIGQLKSDQIQQWRKERLAEIERAAKDSLTIQTVTAALAAPGSPAVQEQLRACMQAEVTGQDRCTSHLFNTTCKLLSSEGGAAEPLTEVTRQAIRTALSQKAAAFSGFYRNPSGVMQIDLAAPVHDAQGQALAVLVLCHEASAYLYPLVQSWPTPSHTAESYLVRRDNDTVVILSDLRHRDDPGGFRRRYPLSEPRSSAAQAVLGQRGIFRGKNYQGVEVVSDLRAIADSPWFMVSEIEDDEILAEVRYRAGAIFLVTALLLLLTAALVGLIYRYRIADDSQRSEARFRAILNASPVPMAGKDAQFNLTFCNAAFEQLFGYPHAEIPLLADWWPRAYPEPGYRQWVMDAWQAERKRVLQSGSAFTPLEVTIRCKNGDAKIVLVSAAPLSEDPEGDEVVVFIDITERKATEARMVRLSMLYAALSECSQAIVHSVSADELLPKICRDVVEHGGMKLAWIGMVDDASGLVRPVAAFGTGTGYLTGLSISMAAGDETGRGPTGTSIRENQPVWCQDFQHDPSTAPWHERGAHFGWNSAASLPLRLRGAAVGCLVIYSDLLQAFDDEVRKLLLEMTANLSFALEHFADEDERHKTEDELKILRTAIEQTANTIVITDPQGAIEYANPAFVTSTGYTLAEALGQNPRVLNSGEQNVSFYQQLWSAITSNQIWRGQFHNKRKDGSLYWESALITPVHNAQGEIAHFIAIKEDVTEQKAMEAKLLDALGRAEAGNRAKNEFLAVMSHELRTPLNGVLGCTDLLADTTLDAEQQDYARMIKDSGNHLLAVVNDILDFSSIESGTMALKNESVVIADLVESSWRPCLQAIENKGLQFRCEIDGAVPARIPGDTQRIGQILINLLANAVKFTAKGSVALRLSLAPDHRHSMLDFVIEDTGIGISPEQLQLLFNPFAQADSTLSRPFEGAGLGLAISRRLAKAMGGTLTVTSTLNQGSSFTFRLPIPADSSATTPAARPAPEPPSAARPPSRDRPILVVEDDGIASLLTGKMVEALGYRAEFAMNGHEAVEAFQPGKYLAILMDMQMPVMGGVEATRRIREIEGEAGGHVPIIALTANVMPADRELCHQAGMDDFLTKPFNKHDFAAMLAQSQAPANCEASLP